MVKKQTKNENLHRLSPHFKKVLESSKKAHGAWEDITPLARNEWICWVESAKKEETREKRMNRAIEDLSKGKRRPCCWAGCIHR